jgi:hypothetical protein
MPLIEVKNRQENIDLHTYSRLHLMGLRLMLSGAYWDQI